MLAALPPPFSPVDVGIPPLSSPSNGVAPLIAVPPGPSSTFFASVSAFSLTIHSTAFANQSDGAQPTIPSDLHLSLLSLPSHSTSSPCFTINASQVIADSTCSTSLACATPTPTCTVFSINPTWGHSLDAAAEVIVIGHPAITAPSTSPINTTTPSSASFIDVVQVISLSGGWDVTSTTLWAFDSPMLGSQLSLSPSGASLAAVYSMDSIAVFSPVYGRTCSVWCADSDAMIALPLTFYVDSLLLTDDRLLVTGFDVSLIQPVLLSYSASAGQIGWNLTGSSVLTRLTQSYLPSAQLPLHPMGSLPLTWVKGMAVIGVAAWRASSFKLSLSYPPLLCRPPLSH